MIQPKRLTTALVAALALSAGCTYLLSRRMDHQALAARRDTVYYVSASRSVLSGELLKPGDLHLTSWPASNPIKEAFTKVEDVSGRTALYPLEPGQPVIDKELTAPGAGTGLASKIPNGMRAIALKSDEVVGVAGFLNPGSHVDVLVTYRSEHQTEPVTATVLQNAEVIAAGQRVEPDPTGKTAPAAATVVTLLLTPPEAERALLASNQGSVHFVLRNSADTSKTDNTSVSLSQLASGTYTAMPVANTPTLQPEVKAEPRKVVVRAAVVHVEKPLQVETILGGQTVAAPSAERTQQ